MKTLRNNIRLFAVIGIVSILFTSCASSTLITSDPPGASLYLDGASVGATPYKHKDSKPIFSCTSVRLEKDGHETVYTEICKEDEPKVGPIVGGFFLVIPWLWALGYRNTYNYYLEPTEKVQKIEKDLPKASTKDKKVNTNGKEDTGEKKSKAERLRELKELLDEGILTVDEFEREKQKILDEK